MLRETDFSSTASKPSDARVREDAREEAPAEADLDAHAAKLPPAYEGHWIAELVRSFVRARGKPDTQLFEEYWQEAMIAATDALRKAQDDPVPGQHTAFVKRAVRSRLTDLNRRRDRRQDTVSLAEDLPRSEEDDGSQHLIEELFAASAFDAMSRELASDFNLALILIGPCEFRTWCAFRDTSGSTREMAEWLGDVSHTTVRTRLLPELIGSFGKAFRLIRTMRNKAA